MASAPGATIPVTLYLHAAARTGHFQRPSTTTLVLAYIVSTGVGTKAPFTPAEVRAWIREKLGLDVDRRRVHEALVELARKGVLERLARGLYVVRDAAKALAEFAKRLTGSRWASVRQKAAQTDSPTSVAPVPAGDGCCVVARWHRRVGRGSPLDWLVSLFLSLGVVEGFARCARRRVRELLRRAGFSKYFVGSPRGCRGWLGGSAAASLGLGRMAVAMAGSTLGRSWWSLLWAWRGHGSRSTSSASTWSAALRAAERRMQAF